VSDAPTVREPEDDEPLVIRPADQAGAEDDPDADQQLDVPAATDDDDAFDAEFPAVDEDEDEPE